MRLLWLIAVAMLFAVPCAQATIDATLQIQLGNPSGATADPNNHDHYLIQRSVESLDYSDHLGEPVWAAWDLTQSDIGGSGRNATFYTDSTLPPNFYHVSTTDYNGVGTNLFNRGHLCPSADRTDTTNDNKLVFYMSNIMPQSALNNQGVWGAFEDYCRSLLDTNELLILCGGSGFGTKTIPSGKVYIPSNTWKVVVCVPLGAGTALSRLNVDTRVIALSIPNVTNGLSSDWQSYVTSPQKIQADTGLTFFSALPANLAQALRGKVDSAPALSVLTLTNSQFLFSLTGYLGTNYVVEATTNLTSGTWNPIVTNAAPFIFSASDALAQCFYRAMLAP